MVIIKFGSKQSRLRQTSVRLVDRKVLKQHVTMRKAMIRIYSKFTVLLSIAIALTASQIESAYGQTQILQRANSGNQSSIISSDTPNYASQIGGDTGGSPNKQPNVDKQIGVKVIGGATKGGSGWAITPSGQILYIDDDNPIERLIEDKFLHQSEILIN
jgi:hypothetical protein